MDIYTSKHKLINRFLRKNSGGTSIEERMIKPIAKPGRNITFDDWFTSVPLAVKFLKYYKKLLW